MKNDEIVYKVSHRSFVYVFAGDFCPAALLLFSSLLLRDEKSSMISISMGVLLLLLGIVFLMDVLTFKDITIYKNRIIINRFIFGALTIDINDIKIVGIGGRLFSSDLDIITKKRNWRSSSIRGLSDIDRIKIEKIINNLQKEHKK